MATAGEVMLGSVLTSKAFQQFTRMAARPVGREITGGLFGTARRR